MFDVDAPTSSGFWHWVFNIPATTQDLVEGAGSAGASGLPTPAVRGRTDFGTAGYGGPCPPEGTPPQRYVIMVVVLDTPDLRIPPDFPAAAVQVVMREHALAYGTRTVRFGR